MYAGFAYAQTGYAMLPLVLDEPPVEIINYFTKPLMLEGMDTTLDLGEGALMFAEAPEEDTTLYLGS